MVHMVAKKMDFSGRIIFNSEKPDGQYRKPSDGTKLNSYLPEFQWTTLEDGIEKTIVWFENNFNNLRK